MKDCRTPMSCCDPHCCCDIIHKPTDTVTAVLNGQPIAITGDAATVIKQKNADIAELVKELQGAGDFARFLINNLSCATTEEDAHYLHIIDTAVAKHKEKQDG